MDLNQVTIYTDKPLETAEFYQKLGLEIIVDSLPRYARFQCPDGSSTLSIHVTDQPAAGSAIALYFECADLDAKVAELEAAGLEMESGPEDQPWLWREAYLRDPSGSRICLYHAGENRKNPPWRVK